MLVRFMVSFICSSFLGICYGFWLALWCLSFVVLFWGFVMDFG